MFRAILLFIALAAITTGCAGPRIAMMASVKKNDVKGVRSCIENKNCIESGYNADKWQRALDRALATALERGNGEMMTYLIGQGANPNSRDWDGRPLLHRAIKMNRSLKMVQLLHKAGANLKAGVRQGQLWETCLSMAVAVNHLGIVTYLLKHGADPNEPRPNGFSYLHDAVKKNRQQLARLLVAHGARVFQPDRQGLTPVWLAYSKNNLAMFGILIAQTDINTVDEKGLSFLHWAVKQQKHGFVTFLLDHGANINMRTAFGHSPLHLAASNGSEELVSLLLKRGADPDLTDHQGIKPLDIARHLGKEHAVYGVLAKVTRKATPRPAHKPVAAGQPAAAAVAPAAPAAPERPGPLPLAKRPIVAVFDVQAKGLDTNADFVAGLSDLIAVRLVETGRFQVVPRSELKSRLTAQKKESYKSCFDDSCQIELGRELAAQKTLATRISRMGSKCTASLSLFDLQKSAAEAAVSLRMDCEEDRIIDSLDDLMLRLTVATR